jgi:hypothetical protein
MICEIYFKPEAFVKIRIFSMFLLLSLISLGSALAQNYDGDARKIAMGGTGLSQNIATSMIEDERSYRTIALPIGLIQLARDIDHFKPKDKGTFDPVLALEYAANPIHITLGRDPGDAQRNLISGIINGNLNTDLNAYRVIKIPTNLRSEGLMSPSWGKTIKFRRRTEGAFQGFYVGAGPYFAAKTDLNIDKGLTDVLGSNTPVSIPNRHFLIGDGSVGQLAMAITGGYRARFTLPTMKSTRDGIYLAMNYNYLLGLKYLDSNIAVRFDTDNAGKLILTPVTTPLSINYYNSSGLGKGYALDFGLGAVFNKWEFGLGASGVANRIVWHDLKLKSYTLPSLVTAAQNQSASFIEKDYGIKIQELTSKLPVRYTGNIAYHPGRYTFSAEVFNGFQKTSFRAGVECRLSRFEFRGGTRYSLDKWHPSGGVGFNITKKLSVDFATFGTTTNLQREMKTGIALSLRINHLKSVEAK